MELCIGRDSRDFIIGKTRVCCKEEIKEEKEIVQTIIDTIDDYSKDSHSLQKVSCKLSYGAHVINHNNDPELLQILPIIKRFAQLIYEFQEKILHDSTIGELTCSFTHEIKRWFGYHFLQQHGAYHHPVQVQSIIADMDTVEMALGVCMIAAAADDDCLDDLFF